MGNSRSDDRLHLPDLSISRFRGIEALKIGRLGRVTLLTGRNGVGKTTVLEAVRVFASRGSRAELFDVLMSRGERSWINADPPDRIDRDRVTVLDIAALFFGRRIAGDGISIGPSDRAKTVNIREIAPTDEHMSVIAQVVPKSSDDGFMRVLARTYGEHRQGPPLFFSQRRSASRRRYARYPYTMHRIPRVAFGHVDSVPTIDCISLGPGLLRDHRIAGFWDAITLTDEESRAVEALRLMLGNDVERIAMIAENDDWRRRSAVVKLRGKTLPVPLSSLGDGAVRLLSVVLGLANSVGGFLVMGEAENGIHHSVQRKFWRMVLKAAHQNNVQVFATTHSWDCVRGFAQAADELEAIEGALVRIEKRNGEMWAVEYSEDQMRVVAEQGIEVR